MTTTPGEATRQEIKNLVDSLPDEQLHAAKQYIQKLWDECDPVLRLLANAPLDDEVVTREDIAAFTETEEDFRTGNVFTHEEMKRELGL